MDLTMFFGISLAFFLGQRFVYSYPSGAPPSVCQTMMPGHNVQQQSTAPQGGIQLSTTTYDGSSLITVTIVGRMMGFMLQARKQGGDMKAIGSFSNIPTGTKMLACSGAVNSLTHTDNSLKNDIKVDWNPPSSDVGSIVFYATIVQSYGVIWVKVPSSAVKYLAKVQGMVHPRVNNNLQNNTTMQTPTNNHVPVTTNTSMRPDAYDPAAEPGTGTMDTPCKIVILSVLLIMFSLLDVY